MSDDKTRIGGGFQFGSPSGGGRVEQFVRPSLPPDDMWFVVEETGTRVEYPLRPGERVTVGRDTTQQIVINDKTLSRHHLVLQRQGDMLQVQVIGLNGLVCNNESFKSTTIELPPSATFTLGKVLCRIRKQADADATVLMSAPQSPARPAVSTPSPYDSRPIPPAFSQASSASSFGCSPQSSVGVEDFPSHSGRTTGQAASISPSAPFPPSSSEQLSSSPSPPLERNYYFGGSDEAKWNAGESKEEVNFDFGSASNDKTKINRLLIGGACFVFFLLLAISLFMFFGSHEEAPAPVQNNPDKKTSQVSAPEVSAQGTVAPPVTGQDYNLHGRFYDLAYRAYQEGKPDFACDYLKDIPATSAYRQQAVDLAGKLRDCKLDQ